MKFLILGASGMAGHTIAAYLKEQGHSVTAFTRKPFQLYKNIVGDAADTDSLKTVIIEGKFDIVINCIGILNQQADVDKANAVFLNSYLPHLLVNFVHGMRTRIIHLSTDCVFSGKNGEYKENALRDGESFYDRTKALGEIDDSKNLTFRNSIVGPDLDENGIGLFNWFMQQPEGAEIQGYKKAIWSGVTTLVLAKAIERAAVTGLSGIYHLVNNEKISKHDLLCLLNKYFKRDSLIINASETVVVDKSLINTRTDFDFTVPSYEEMIKELAWRESK